MTTVPYIGKVAGLSPKMKYFEETGDNCLNADAAIALMQRIDTPQAKAIYAKFRKRLALLQVSMHGTSPEKIREEALFKALSDMGIRTSFTNIKGEM